MSLSLVEVKPKRLADYAPVVGQEAIEELHRLPEPLRDARVLQINATGYGGGVADDRVLCPAVLLCAWAAGGVGEGIAR